MDIKIYFQKFVVLQYNKNITSELILIKISINFKLLKI